MARSSGSAHVDTRCSPSALHAKPDNGARWGWKVLTNSSTLPSAIFQNLSCPSSDAVKKNCESSPEHSTCVMRSRCSQDFSYMGLEGSASSRRSTAAGGGGGKAAAAGGGSEGPMSESSESESCPDMFSSELFVLSKSRVVGWSASLCFLRFASPPCGRDDGNVECCLQTCAN
jgi:hypothetical protein